MRRHLESPSSGVEAICCLARFALGCACPIKIAQVQRHSDKVDSKPVSPGVVGGARCYRSAFKRPHLFLPQQLLREQAFGKTHIHSLQAAAMPENMGKSLAVLSLALTQQAVPLSLVATTPLVS